MITFRFVDSEEDINRILPLLTQLSKETGASLRTSLQEIASPNSLLQVREEDGVVVGYLCGYFFNSEDFYLCQSYNSNPTDATTSFQAYAERVKELGGKKIFAHAVHPTVFEKYGFEVERYVVCKDLTGKATIEKSQYFQDFTERMKATESLVARDVIKARVRQGACPFDGLKTHFSDALLWRKMRRYYQSHINDPSFKEELLNLLEVENG